MRVSGLMTLMIAKEINNNKIVLLMFRSSEFVKLREHKEKLGYQTLLLHTDDMVC